MGLLIYDLERLYRQTFGGKPYRIGSEEQLPPDDPFRIDGQNTLQQNGDIYDRGGSSVIQTTYLGKEIWLPVKLLHEDLPGGAYLLPYTVISIEGEKNIVKTPLAERKGSVRELYNIDDYDITVKGFLIDDKDRVWPSSEIARLQDFYESFTSLGLDNALTNIFLKDSRVVITKLSLPEVVGGRKHVRPFVMKLESDSVFELELRDV